MQRALGVERFLLKQKKKYNKENEKKENQKRHKKIGQKDEEGSSMQANRSEERRVRERVSFIV